MTLASMERGTSVVAWHVPLDGKRNIARDRSRCCADSYCQARSKESPARRFSGSQPCPPLVGSLACILPGQVLSLSPPRRAPAAAKRMGCKRCSPGRRSYVTKHGRNCSTSCLTTAVVISDGCDGCSNRNSSAGSGTSEKILAYAEILDGRISSSTAVSCDIKEECASSGRGRQKLRDSSSTSLQGSAPTAGLGDAVDRLIARCMTHERPTSLVQASAVLLDACIMRLGEEVIANEKRSDRIRRMLRLTDEIRRYNADLTEYGVATQEDIDDATTESCTTMLNVAASGQSSDS